MRSTIFAAAFALLAAGLLPLLSGCNQSYADRVVAVGPDELTVTNGPNGLEQTHEVAPDAKIAIDGEPAALEEIKPGDAVKVTTDTQGEEEVAVKIDVQRMESAEPDLGTGEIGAPLTPPAISPLPGDSNDPVIRQPDREGFSKQEGEQAESTNEKSAEAGQVKPDQPNEEQSTTPGESEASATLFHGKIDLVSPHRLRVQADADMTHLATKMVFTVTEDTEIVIAAKPATLDDLSEGMTVTVIATKNGDRALAERIEAEPMPG